MFAFEAKTRFRSKDLTCQEERKISHAFELPNKDYIFLVNTFPEKYPEYNELCDDEFEIYFGPKHALRKYDVKRDTYSSSGLVIFKFEDPNYNYGMQMKPYTSLENADLYRYTSKLFPHDGRSKDFFEKLKIFEDSKLEMALKTFDPAKISQNISVQMHIK